MKLTELRKGEEARIIKIDKTGELKKDWVIWVLLLEYWLDLKEMLLWETQQYYIKGNNIAIRKIDADNIIVEK